MYLVIILLSLFAERAIGSLAEMRQFGWFNVWTDWVSARLPHQEPWQRILAVVLVLAGPFLLVAIVGAWMWALWLVFGILFALLALLYSFGPQDLEAQVEALLAARERGDDEAAQWHAADLLGERSVENSRELTRATMETILIETHERYLGVVFWFVILGPAGAVLYRLSCLLNGRFRNDEGEFAAACSRLHEILAWIPVRLTAFAYALSGSFVDAMQYWRDEAAKWRDLNRGILVSAGFGAMRFQPPAPEEDAVATGLEDIRTTASLARRTVVVWLAVLGLMTLAGWG